MKKTKAILITAMLCTMASVCWGQSYWKRTYGGTKGGVANSITRTPDGNFIVAGEPIFIGNGDYHVYLLKITPHGDTLWTKTYGEGINDVHVSGITQTTDGNFMVARQIESDEGQGAVYLLKINPNGDTLWTRTYGGNAWCGASAITPASDGNFIIVGQIESDESWDVYLLKINQNGDTLWTRTYGRNEWCGASAITPTSDGNFIVAGYTSSGAGDYHVYLLKITPHGDTLWTKTYGGPDDDQASAITLTTDGNFIVAGQIESYTGQGHVYLLKITPHGDTLWTKTYGENTWCGASAITPTNDGDFIVAGQIESDEGQDAYFLKINPNGDTLWTKMYGGTGEISAAAITSTGDGNFIVAGNTYFSDIGINDIWLLSIIDDRYAKKDSLFTFKIPVSGDSLNHGYSPLKVPSGMSVSIGGTISWTPKTASVYMDHAEFLVSDDFGNKDTLTFNIFVNSKNQPTAIKTLSRPIPNKNQAFSIMQTSSSQIKFTLPPGASNIDIYDINGRCVQRIKPLGAQTIWNGLSAAGNPVSSGRYFAKIKESKTSRMGQFSVVR